MSLNTTLDLTSRAAPATGSSGARLQAVRAAAALDFLQRFGPSIDVSHADVDAWGAFEDGTTMIGAGALIRVSDAALRAQVAVAPERRRLGIGGDLLGVILRDAAEAGARVLTGSCPARAVEPQRLVGSLGLVSARRVQGDRAEVVIFVPRPSSTPPGGPR